MEELYTRSERIGTDVDYIYRGFNHVRGHMDKQPMTLIHTCGRSTEGETRDRSKRVLVKGKRVSKSWVLR